MTLWLLPRLKLLFGIAAVMIVLQLINSLDGYSLNRFGLIPREVRALPGIALAPWLHGSWLHLFGNLSGFMVLGALALLESRAEFIRASLFIIVFSGVLVWLFGRTGIHVGSSGWLFGLWGLLLGRAWFRRSLADLLLAALALVLYGGFFYGLLPQQGVSFEYHLAGALCGGLYASWQRGGQKRRTRKRPRQG